MTVAAIKGERRLNQAYLDRQAAIVAGFTHDELQAAFSAVQNADDWRAPVDAWVHVDDLPVTMLAIEFFTATRAAVVNYLGYTVAGGCDRGPIFHGSTYPAGFRGNRDGQYVHLQAVGYRKGPAGDH